MPEVHDLCYPGEVRPFASIDAELVRELTGEVLCQWGCLACRVPSVSPYSGTHEEHAPTRFQRGLKRERE